MRVKKAGVLSFVVFIIGMFTAHADDADVLYRMHRKSVYQIRVIENTSGEKAVIGSAFCVGTNGYLATNYHVVSLAMRYPKLYRIECVGSDKKSFSIHIKDVDVIHDLAIVRSDRNLQNPFVLNLSPLNKGETIFSLGNPLDLGMAIVEGTYNGLLEKSFYEKILFSGSLNGGMSGGPAIDALGRVIGINVSTAGKQISFLVPAKYLDGLLARTDHSGSSGEDSLDERVEQQLVENQRQYLSRLLDAEWTSEPFGEANIPRVQDKAMQNWGDVKRDEEALYDHTRVISRSKDWIYLSPNLSTGKVSYECSWYARGELNGIRFYNLLESDFGKSKKINGAEEEDVTNFKSQQDFVTIAGRDWRVVLSARNYKKYPRLHDLVVKMVTVSDIDTALMVKLELLGVTEEMGLTFVRKIMEGIQWQN